LQHVLWGFMLSIW